MERERILYCQIEEGQKRRSMTSMHVTLYYSQGTQGTDTFFLEIQVIALFFDKEKRWSLVKFPPAPPR